MRWAGHVGRIREEMNAFWWEIQKKKRLLGRHRRKWEDNIKMDLREIGRGGMD
jgi:hypothetical protein